jgi:hypothetical protein
MATGTLKSTSECLFSPNSNIAYNLLQINVIICVKQIRNKSYQISFLFFVVKKAILQKFFLDHM